MSILIPSNLTLNRRSYGVGIEVELDESNLPVTKDHPLVVLALKYIASPVSSEDYDTIEDNFGNYLNSGLLERIAEDDVDFDFDKEEYDRVQRGGDSSESDEERDDEAEIIQELTVAE